MLKIILYLLAIFLGFGGFVFLFRRNETVIWALLWVFAIIGFPAAWLYGFKKEYGITDGYSEFYPYAFFFGMIETMIAVVVGVVLLVTYG